MHDDFRCPLRLGPVVVPSPIYIYMFLSIRPSHRFLTHELTKPIGRVGQPGRVEREKMRHDHALWLQV